MLHKDASHSGEVLGWPALERATSCSNSEEDPNKRLRSLDIDREAERLATLGETDFSPTEAQNA